MEELKIGDKVKITLVTGKNIRCEVKKVTKTIAVAFDKKGVEFRFKRFYEGLVKEIGQSVWTTRKYKIK